MPIVAVTAAPLEIARAHREKKPVFGGKPPKAVREDRYEPALASDRDIAWARSFGVGVLTDMPEKSQKGAVLSRKRPVGTPRKGPRPWRVLAGNSARPVEKRGIDLAVQEVPEVHGGASVKLHCVPQWLVGGDHDVEGYFQARDFALDGLRAAGRSEETSLARLGEGCVVLVPLADAYGDDKVVTNYLNLGVVHRGSP